MSPVPLPVPGTGSSVCLEQLAGVMHIRYIQDHDTWYLVQGTGMLIFTFPLDVWSSYRT